MSAVPLRALIVEDSQDDAALLVRAVRKGGYEPSVEVVETEDAMRTALTDKPWDIILCDFRMPNFDGFRALAVLKESGLDIPFILVSGDIGEDIAVEAMKAGASDYVMKGNLQRLIPAIERELNEAASREEKKKAQKALRESEERFSKAFLFSPDPMTINAHADGSIVSASNGFCQTFGYTEEEVVGKSPLEIKIWDDPEDWNRFVEKVKTEGKADNVECRWRNKKGDLIYGLVSGSIIYLSGAPHIFIVAKDITERKQLEQEKESLIIDLQKALSEVKQLSRFLPICSSCKKIRDDQGYWNEVETYISKHSETQFSHGICPDCACKLYPELFEDEQNSPQLK